jgi:hypothetical protein
MDGVWSRLAYVFVRNFPELLAEVGERFRKRTLGGSPGGLGPKPFSSTQPTHVDPGFAFDRVRFRLEEERGGGFKFQVQRVNDGAVAHRPPTGWQNRDISVGGS